jgi:hypothetical protein
MQLTWTWACSVSLWHIVGDIGSFSGSSTLNVHLVTPKIELVDLIEEVEHEYIYKHPSLWFFFYGPEDAMNLCSVTTCNLTQCNASMLFPLLDSSMNCKL